MITSIQKIGDTSLRDWKQAKLLRASFVRAKLVTIDPSLILQKIGRIRPHDLQACQSMLKQYFGM